jgi:hypothetical protein
MRLENQPSARPQRRVLIVSNPEAGPAPLLRPVPALCSSAPFSSGASTGASATRTVGPRSSSAPDPCWILRTPQSPQGRRDSTHSRLELSRTEITASVYSACARSIAYSAMEDACSARCRLLDAPTWVVPRVTAIGWMDGCRPSRHFGDFIDKSPILAQPYTTSNWRTAPGTAGSRAPS